MSEKKPFTVAVVDDDAAIRKLVILFLRRAGYGVTQATTAAEARPLLSNQPWDLAILDRRLPDADGAVLCHEIKSNPALRNRYVIMLTGEDEQSDKIEGLDLGADDYVTKPFQHAELLARVRAGKRIADLQNELIESNRRLELLSITDGLTKLYNHRHFQEELTRAFDEAERYQRPLSVAILDIDFFKKVNDTYGHATGDEVLKAVAAIFADSIRASDLAARYGGEEFTVMMPETALDDAIAFAEKIRTTIESARIETTAGTVAMTISIGVASYPQLKATSARQIVEAADKALYRAKRGGRNQVQAERRNKVNRKTKAG